MFPGYNNGNGLATGANDLSGVNAFNWSAAERYNPGQQGSIIDKAGYFTQLALNSIFGIANIIFASLWAAPALLSIFGVNPVLTGILLALMGIILILAWLQIAKGDDWSGRR